tara:strand:+ start:198 stop:887 length:690 start_codon:yes stop_codon:yes gene_type:complete
MKRQENSARLWLLELVASLDSIETLIRFRIADAFHAMPGFLHYKVIKRIRFLEEIMNILEPIEVSYFVVGGLAHDGKRGRLTRHHTDVDLAFLEEDISSAFSALTNNGFAIHMKTPYIYVARKGALHADIFNWKSTEDGQIQFVMHDQLIRIPRSFFMTGQNAQLMGSKFRIPSDKFLKSILPVMLNSKDREYVTGLNIEKPLIFDVGIEDVLIPARVTVHQYSENTEL